MSKIKINTNPDDKIQFPIVGIGASAGGLAAVKEFLSAVPKKSGIAYVFVQHLSPTHESFLTEILKHSSKIPVQEITDNIHLEPDHLYVIPSNKMVIATDGILKLSSLDSKHPKKKVIDIFFSSLAVVHQGYAIGVVLSGTLNDGTLGLQVIKAYGGITFAQNEASATHDGMPKSAIDAGAVDFILTPAQIAAHIIKINNPFHEDLNTLPVHDEEVFKQLLTVLRVRRGVDFTYYKPSTLRRRIVRRMALNAIEKPTQYLSFLRENKLEQDALYNDMLISVTDFYRDPATFELLCTTIFPNLIKQKEEGDEPLRIWIAGCATGEEAYSMAMCLQEQLGDKAAAMKIQIFATDISETAIAKARLGIYRATDLKGLSPLRIQQFFTKLNGNYQVNKIIRDMCVFAHHNLLKDPPFSKVDLISCRNVMIYLEPVLQKKALTTFHYALNEIGFLMLGKSENINRTTDLFKPYNSHEKIFKRNGAKGRFMQVTTHGGEQNFKDIDKGIKAEHNKHDIFKIADELVLKSYGPSGVLINEQFDIMQFRGNTDTWLAPSPGKASLNVLKMTREGLSFELRNLLHLAKKSNHTARKENVLFILKDEQYYVNIEVIPLTSLEDLHYLILFEEVKGLVRLPITKQNKSKKVTNDLKDLRIIQLEKELIQSHLDMRTITEEQEVVNEELQSANQELLSSSEELQSLNEELETSKEELQSTNEEISIVNNELLDRNEQLNSAKNYSEGIIKTIRDPLIILDKDLKVIRATEGFYTKFMVNEKETEGKYIYELGNKQWDIPELRKLLEGILPEKKTVADFEVITVFPSIGRRVMCLNSKQLDKINGDQLILLAIEDMTDKRKVEEGLAAVEMLFKESKERLKLAVDAAGLGTWDYNPITGELIWDQRSKELFALPADHQVNYQQFIEMIHIDDRKQVDEYFKYVLAGVNNGEYENEFKIGDGLKKTKWIKFKGKAYFDEDGVAYRFVGTSLDITQQKTHEEATNELLKQKDDFISIASHELKTPITTLKASLQLIDRMKNQPSPEKLDNLVGLSIKSLDKVSVLIEDLLNVSKLNQGQLHFNKTLFAIKKMVEECCHHVRMEGKYRIVTTGDSELKVYADPDRIDQVVVNFVNNAIKYAPNTKEILIHVEKINDVVKVSVKDKGPGIPSDKLSHLFERYYRVDESGNQTSGLGLGLYICSEIIKKHNGNIGVDSEVGKGSTFWFTLPLS